MTDLLRTLEAEAGTMSRFVELLKCEQLALGNGDIDKLVDSTQEKNALASELTSLAEQRNSQLQNLGFEKDRPGIEAWLLRQPASAQIGSTWSQILSCASEARELNRLNGELIQMRMLNNTQALEAMRSTYRTLHLYGPNGQTEPLLSQRINDAA